MFRRPSRAGVAVRAALHQRPEPVGGGGQRARIAGQYVPPAPDAASGRPAASRRLAHCPACQHRDGRPRRQGRHQGTLFYAVKEPSNRANRTQ